MVVAVLVVGLTWGRVAELSQRWPSTFIVDTPKTEHSVRQAALAEGILRELELWRSQMISCRPETFVLPEKGTAWSKDNVCRRNMQPKLPQSVCADPILLDVGDLCEAAYVL